MKFAGLLHFINVTALSERQMMGDVIELTTLKGAIELTRYFASQAMTTIKLYDPSAPKLNEFQRRLIETLSGLKEEVRNGKLALTKIAEAYNTGLPPQAQHSHKMLGPLLRQLKLTTIMSTGGRYFLKWDQTHLDQLFSLNMSTSPTMSTKSVTSKEILVDMGFSKSTNLNYTPNNGSGTGKVEIVDFQKSKSPAPSQQHQGEVEKVDQVDVFSNEEPRVINWKENWQLEES